MQALSVEGRESEVTHTRGAKVLFVDPESVFRAAEALRVNSKDLRNIEEYCRSFEDSNISSITKTIDDLCKSHITMFYR